jgi:hypothetical protein
MRTSRLHFLILAILVLILPAACTEVIEVQSTSDYHDFLAVEAMLTDRPDHPQRIILTQTLPYFEEAKREMVRGASVQVDDVVFQEKEAGTYVAPSGYCCQPDHEYHLKIRLSDGREYTAEATMPEPGFILDDIDYAYLGGMEMDLDSTWTIGVWGLEKDIRSHYLVNYSVNGNLLPLLLSYVTIDDYFSGKEIKGFPLMFLMQTSLNQAKYGECFKFLETGDVLTLNVYTVDEPFYKYLTALTMDALYIPLISPQPTNPPCNIHGENVVGYFAICSHVDASVEIEDPLRSYFKKSLPFF